MARIAVRRDAFELGQFPPVCCKTGQGAQLYNRWEFSDTPGWTWILLLFGIFPFLIATAFVTKRFPGVLPISVHAQTRLNTMRRIVWIFGIAAVVLGAAGLLAGSDGMLVLAVASAVLWLGAIALTWFSSPSANLDGDDVVVLTNVHRDFVAAIRAIPAAPGA
jgi:hypothetical protein